MNTYFGESFITLNGELKGELNIYLSLHTIMFSLAGQKQLFMKDGSTV